MEIDWSMLQLICIIVLLIMQVVSQVILNRKIGKALTKLEKYVNYIVEADEGTSNPINIEETPSKGLDERQKELLLQEMLDGFFA